MQPRPGKNKNTGAGWSNKKKAAPGMKPVVDPRPGNKAPRVQPVVDTDSRIYRTMPITEKQLGAIKKMYGIK